MKTLLLLALLVLIAGVANAADAAASALAFKVYNGDPDEPKSLDFQIHVNRTGPTHFYKLGETILGTKWKIENFEYKTAFNGAGRETDVSELRLRHLETKKALILPLDKVVALPASGK